MNYRHSRMMMWIGFAVGILVCSISLHTDWAWPIAVGSVLFFAGLGQAFLFYRCPSCGSSLMNVRGEIPQHCPYCGKALD